MGDFDRHETPKGKSQGKQIAIMVLLGVVLIGVLGVHFMKQGPQAASAAGTGDLSALPVIEGTPEEAGQQLLKNPYKDLLTGDKTTDVTLNQSPHNPFVMDKSWIHDITIPPAQVAVASTQTTTPQAVIVKPVPPKGVKLDNYKLGSIVRQNDKYMAILNGHVVTAGMVIDGARVIEIRADRVILQHEEFADGPKAELMMANKLNN